MTLAQSIWLKAPLSARPAEGWNGSPYTELTGNCLAGKDSQDILEASSASEHVTPLSHKGWELYALVAM